MVEKRKAFKFFLEFFSSEQYNPDLEEMNILQLGETRRRRTAAVSIPSPPLNIVNIISKYSFIFVHNYRNVMMSYLLPIKN